MKKFLVLLIVFCFTLSGCSVVTYPLTDETIEFTMPAESAKHQGTWLTWPHDKTYGKEYMNNLVDTWVQMVVALTPGEMVHIVVYDDEALGNVSKLLREKNVDMDKVEFLIEKTDDVWIRDNGPIYVRDNAGVPSILDFKFDGWGGKSAFKKDDKLPATIARSQNTTLRTYYDIVLEGGSIETDGNGTLMATKSSVASFNRNDGVPLKYMEPSLKKLFGATNIIWLDGVMGEDLTDAHIDTIARFVDGNKIVTLSRDDLKVIYPGITTKDYENLLNAKNAQGEPYQIVELPITKENVKDFSTRGTYVGYYVANDVVLVPAYGDENDVVAQNKLQELFPTKKIVPINAKELFKNGASIHAVTQQQPEFK